MGSPREQSVVSLTLVGTQTPQVAAKQKKKQTKMVPIMHVSG